MIAESGNKKELGKVNAGVLVAAYVPLIILTPFYCYHMAVKQGQEKPYPAATITSTACHYPQDIAFRYFMLIASSLLALIFFLIFRWTAAAVKRANYPRVLPSSLYYTTQFSILLYGITIGTIDSRGTGPLHSPCAVAFFLILIIAIIRVTLFLTELRAYDTSVIAEWSLRVKQVLALYLLLLWIYCIIMLISVSSEELEGKGDKYVVIVEWNTVTMGLLWVLSFYPEWKHLALTLTAP
jgi:hypothetical protein